MGASETATKRGGRRLNAALSDRKVKAAKPGRHFDGHGLFLLVSPGGGKLWKQRVAIHGRRVELGLGGYPLVTLAAARETALENRRMARAGRDPRTERRRSKAEMLTFEAAAREVHKFYRERWRSEKYADEWLASLARDVFPKIGTRPVNAIDVQDVTDVLMPVYRERPVSAKRVGQRIGVVLKWAIAQRLRADNPVEAAKVLLPKRAPETPRRALHYSDVPAAVEVVRESSCDTSTKLALEFVVLTAARGGEARGATWNEIDTDAATWTVPAERMKSGREHRVPLSPRALEILAAARAMRTARTDLIFPGRTGRPMVDSSLVHALHRLGIDATVHGFRSSFRDWASERTSAPHAVMEAALAHVIPNKAVAAYARSDLLDKRRDLMERWAAFVTTKPGEVVSIATGRAVS